MTELQVTASSHQDDPPDAPAGNELLYTAELVLAENGTHALTVRDHSNGTKHTTCVSPKAVRLLPVYLSKLGLQAH